MSQLTANLNSTTWKTPKVNGTLNVTNSIEFNEYTADSLMVGKWYIKYW